MKKYMFAGWLFLCPLSCLSAASTNSSYTTYSGSDKRIGDFNMVALGPKDSIGLSNNLFYMPTNKEDRRLIRDWLPGHRIRVLITHDWDRYALINLETGQSIKTKIYSWK